MMRVNGDTVCVTQKRERRLPQTTRRRGDRAGKRMQTCPGKRAKDEDARYLKSCCRQKRVGIIHKIFAGILPRPIHRMAIPSLILDATKSSRQNVLSKEFLNPFLVSLIEKVFAL